MLEVLQTKLLGSLQTKLPVASAEGEEEDDPRRRTRGGDPEHAREDPAAAAAGPGEVGEVEVGGRGEVGGLNPQSLRFSLLFVFVFVFL